ncbi:MAG: 16S rRNA (uracil(1498)-N(3))-methyltransferase [Pirellulales bacterium]|nr:16S rRNA (uracil(1498)-N(3))-methyltransferase [Pirellulales bacterium]
MTDRYYSETPITGSTATLTGSEAHHLLHVMRAKPGRQLVVFDGQGGEYQAEVSRCGRKEVELQLGPHRDVDCELSFELTLAVALPKGDRQRWLVEKAVELGVTRLVPLTSIHSVMTGKSTNQPKLDRYVIEASKQCGRNRLMEILPTTPWVLFFREPVASRRLLAHPGGRAFHELGDDPTADTWVAIGPEGGFTEAEAEQAVAAGWETVDLGSRTLRIETAALALVSALVLGQGMESHRT